jgi:transcriptional repressor NrdR
VERTTIKVVKKDGARVPFDRNRLKQGLEKACWKRPIRDAKLEAIVSEIENHVESHFDSEVESRYLGELVMQRLRELDQVAYVRFASVYRQFEDARDFVDELKPMLSESPRPPR